MNVSLVHIPEHPFWNIIYSRLLSSIASAAHLIYKIDPALDQEKFSK